MYFLKLLRTFRSDDRVFNYMCMSSQLNEHRPLTIRLSIIRYMLYLDSRHTVTGKCNWLNKILKNKVNFTTLMMYEQNECGRMLISIKNHDRYIARPRSVSSLRKTVYVQTTPSQTFIS